MASSAAQLSALGNDQQFRYRIRTIVLQHAAVVYAEPPATPDTRRQFAKDMMHDPSAAERLAPVIATRGNLAAQTTSFDFDGGQVVTDATDAQILSQVATDWDMLAGV